MCAINGIFSYHYAAGPVAEAELRKTRDHMAARGPDAAGLWIGEDAKVGFGHRRLAILDLTDAGAQPMEWTSSKLVITFNGEIYNFRELRGDLEARGYRLRSHSDTEVLLALYADKGEEMLNDLRGMFAFAIWDGRDRSLFLARDPNGIKPLYYSDDGWRFRFASQVKALLAGGGCCTTQDTGALVGFHVFGYVPEPMTMFHSIRALPAGSCMRVIATGCSGPKTYYSIPQMLAEAAAAPPPSLSDVREAFVDSVKHHLIADVPVGAFLSAGIDSGAIVGLMRDAGQKEIETITIGFKEFENKQADETAQARTVSAHHGTKHSTRFVSKSEFLADLPKIMTAMDQPSIDGFNTWFVAKATREKGLKVALSGLGGDELLGGYKSFRQIPELVKWLAIPSRIPFLGQALRIGAEWAGIFESLHKNPKAAGTVEYASDYASGYLLRRAIFMPWELVRVLGRDLAEDGLSRFNPLEHVRRALVPLPRSPFARVCALETTLYMRNQLLRDSDWASMAHGLELRVPLVDIRLQRKLACYILSQRYANGKALLGEAPSNPVPVEIRSRRKTGFETPVVRWLATSGTGSPRYVQTRELVRALASTGNFSC